MLTRRALAGLAATGSLALSLAPAAAQSRRGEVDALRRFAETKHPRGLEAAQSAAWREVWSKLAAKADAMNDGVYVVELRRALSWFADGHTTVLPFEFVGSVSDAMKAGPFGMALPLTARAFHDGYWVVKAKDEARPLLGSRIISVADVPIGKILGDMIGSWPAENPAWGHNWAGLLLSSVGLLHGLGVVKGAPDAPIPVEAVDRAGNRVTATLRPRADAGKDHDELERTPTAVETYAKDAGRTNFVRRLDDRGALYVGIDDMADLDSYPFERLTAEAMAAMAAPAIRRLVIDLRRNGGGDNYFGETIRREIARSRFNAPGGLYVLIAPQTFSAAQNLANRLERETLSFFVGEPTGSAPNMHGDPELFAGPVTGVTAMCSTLRWYDGGPHDKRRWIFPDVFAPKRFDDWFAGRDAALDAALSHVPDPNWGFKDRVRYFERASQNQTWKPFWA